MANNGEPRLDGRNGLVWRRATQGWTQERIAEEMGLSQPRVSQIIAAVRATLPKEDREKLRQDTAELYDDFLAKLADLAEREPIPAYSNGRPIVAEWCQGAPDCHLCEGKDRHAVRYAEDHSGRVKAIEAAVKLSAEKRKMLGLDEPAAITVTGDVTDRLAQVAAQAAARLAGNAVPSGQSADDSEETTP